jgi:hypothetical protein
MFHIFLLACIRKWEEKGVVQKPRAFRASTPESRGGREERVMIKTYEIGRQRLRTDVDRSSNRDFPSIWPSRVYRTTSWWRTRVAETSNLKSHGSRLTTHTSHLRERESAQGLLGAHQESVTVLRTLAPERVPA